ncbi:MAG: glutamine amidotransferase [Dehalococcoidia bacterium]|nr:glutamine amidotransferase [Dehalococcoidia bacterium]
MRATLALTLGYLYADLMNIYADRGNIICFAKRCQWRGISLEIERLGIDAVLNPADYDILFIGGGQDKEQTMAAADLKQSKGEAVREAVESGVVALAICGGFQLFGQYYRPAEGEDLPGIGLFDAWTIHKGPKVPRCIGNVVVDWKGQPLVGFENHGGRTYLGPNCSPLGRVVMGFGNNAGDGTEGAVYKNAFGTYLHGSLLPKNPHFADHLLKLALFRKYGEVPFLPLDDTIEMAAHEAAVARTREGKR